MFLNLNRYLYYIPFSAGECERYISRQKLSPSSSSALLKKMLDSGLIAPVPGHGKGKYRFKQKNRNLKTDCSQCRFLFFSSDSVHELSQCPEEHADDKENNKDDHDCHLCFSAH